MDLEKITPLIQKAFQDALEEKRYPFGFSKYTGMSNKVASGSLKNSIEVKTKGNTEIDISMNDYGQWVQSGRAAGKKGVPISAIISWIKARGLKGRNKKGRYIKDTSFAFAIQTNIKKFGIKRSDWYDVAIDNLLENKQIEELLGDATYEDLINALEGI
jgi:hypothetical protein